MNYFNFLYPGRLVFRNPRIIGSEVINPHLLTQKREKYLAQEKKVYEIGLKTDYLSSKEKFPMMHRSGAGMLLMQLLQKLPGMKETFG